VKNKILHKIGLLCGLIPLTVGLFIFFAWWTARAFFAFDLHSFEAYGFIWTLISIPVASIGLLLLTIFAFKNYPNFLRESILGLFLVLVNIPIANLVLLKEADIETRAYIKIYNKTKQDNVEIKLKASDFEKSLGKFSDTETIVDFYYPKYIDERGGSSYPTIDSVTLIVKDKFTTRYITLPRIDKGDCRKLYVDKEFKLLDKWE
jgi:hypothetical protein